MFSRKFGLASCEAERAREDAWLAKTARALREDVSAYPDLGQRPRSGRPGVMARLVETAAQFEGGPKPPGSACFLEVYPHDKSARRCV